MVKVEVCFNNSRLFETILLKLKERKLYVFLKAPAIAKLFLVTFLPFEIGKCSYQESFPHLLSKQKFKNLLYL